MDEEKYWSNLEKVYVHNVYESISSKYDEFLKLTSRSANRYYNNSNQHNKDENDVLLNNELNNEFTKLLNATTNRSTNTTNTDLTKALNKANIDLIINHKLLKTSNNILNNSNNKIAAKFRYENGYSLTNNHTKQNGNGNHLRTPQKYNAWPKVKQFLKHLDSDSLVADVGCGEGKYLNLNNKLFTIGCDRSSSLCQLASAKYSPHASLVNQNQILVCDNLSLPFRSDLFDAVISIGVIHHFSTIKRRIKAVQELCRILKPGGKLMIYVWAMEQRLRNFNSQDVLVPLLDTSPAALRSNEYKFNLRRDLSNNSTANSEDSNDESSTCENNKKSYRSYMRFNSYGEQLNHQNSLKSNSNDVLRPNKSAIELDTTKDNILNDHSNIKNKIQIDINSNEENCENLNKLDNCSESTINTPTSPSNTNSPMSNSDSNSCSLSINVTSITSAETNSTSTSNESNRNFVENLRFFFSKKFTSNTNRKQNLQKSNSEEPNLYLSLPQPTKLDPQSNLVNSNLNSIERYKQIIEQHKDLLPKDFTIRQFPYSSCQDTFDPNESSNDEKKLDLTSFSSSPSQSPSSISPMNPSPKSTTSNTSNSQSNDESNHQHSFSSSSTTSSNSNEYSNVEFKSEKKQQNQKCELNYLEEDSNNNLNKRFYHVFRRNELDNLVRENCSNLIIYDSYYDHGNWCICARKE